MGREYPGAAQGLPHHGRGTGEDRFAEVMFEHIQYRQSGQAGAIEEHRWRFRRMVVCQICVKGGTHPVLHPPFLDLLLQHRQGMQQTCLQRERSLSDFPAVHGRR